MKPPLQTVLHPAVATVLVPVLVLSAIWMGLATAATHPRGTLGVVVGEITPQVQHAAGLQQVTGAVIQQVLPGSAAAQVGLQPGDLIIGVDGIGVSGATEVVQRIAQHGAGDRVALVILRPDGHGRVQQFQVTPVLQPAPVGFAPDPATPQPYPPVPGAPPPQRPHMAPSPLGTAFSGGMVPVRLHMDVYRTCLAVAPANWVIYGSRREGDALDMAAGDESMCASYGIAGVPGSLIRYYPRSATPESRLQTILSEGGRIPVSYGQPMRDATSGYTWLPFEFPERYKGVVLYRVWPIPNDPSGYIMLERRAQTFKHLWERQGAQAIFVALSIRCTRQLRPSPDAVGRGGSDDDRAESTYNQQLGMEYAHDPATGENYWVSPGTDWRDTGPEGPGYYKRSGNDWRKLVPGRSN